MSAILPSFPIEGSCHHEEPATCVRTAQKSVRGVQRMLCKDRRDGPTSRATSVNDQGWSYVSSKYCKTVRIHGGRKRDLSVARPNSLLIMSSNTASITNGEWLSGCSNSRYKATEHSTLIGCTGVSGVLLRHAKSRASRVFQMGRNHHVQTLRAWRLAVRMALIGSKKCHGSGPIVAGFLAQTPCV